MDDFEQPSDLELLGRARRTLRILQAVALFCGVAAGIFLSIVWR